jgi:uncharacterized Zn-finger protein
MSDKYIEGIHSSIIYDGYFGYICDVPEHQNDHYHHFIDIHKATWLVCEGCKKVKLIATHLFVEWWDETEEMWRARAKHIGDYDFL